MDKTEKYIKDYLRDKKVMAGTKRGDLFVPDFDAFYGYCQDELKDEAFQRVQDYIVANPWAQEMVLTAKRLTREAGTEKEIPAGLESRAKNLKSAASLTGQCPHCGKAITPFKKPLSKQKWLNLGWFVLAIAVYGLSFAFKRYFMQCLVVCLLAAVKGIVEAKATKTQIMIYKAISEEPDGHSHRLSELHKHGE